MLTEIQKQVVVGSLLGDGSIWTNFVSPNCKFTKVQSKVDHRGIDKETYMNWHKKVFGCFVSSIRELRFKGVKNKFYERYTLTTHQDELWNEIDEEWYTMELVNRRVKRTKVVPELKLTPLIACVWYMDDGSNYAKDANITLETHAFTKEEVNFLINRLREDLSITSKLKKTKKQGQFRIYIGRKSYFDFIDMIKPHVEWDCFKHKLDTSGYTKKPHRGESHSLAKLTESKVKEIFELRDGGLLQKEIADAIGINKTTVSLVLSGKHWKHLGMCRPTKNKPRITREIKEQILALSQDGESQNHIAEQLHINQSTVSRCLREVCHAQN